MSYLTKSYEQINALAFSHDGKYLASGGNHNPVIQLWDLDSGNTDPTLIIHHKYSGISALIFQPDNTLLGFNELGPIIAWDIHSGEPKSAKKYIDQHMAMAFSNDGRIFVSGDPNECKIRLWDIAAGSKGGEFQELQNSTTPNPISKLLGIGKNKKKVKKGVEKITISRDNMTVASAHDDNLVRLWDSNSGIQRRSLSGHTEIIYTLAFSADSELLASGSADNTIRLWNVSKSRFQAKLSGHKNAVKALAFSPIDNNILASGSADGTIRFWDTNTGDEQQIVTGYIESIKALAFTKNNGVLCSAASNGTVQIWNVNKATKLPNPTTDHHDMVDTVAFSDDATLFAYQGSKTTIRSRGTGFRVQFAPQGGSRLIRLPLGDELASFEKYARGISFSPDNRVLAIHNPHHGIQLWDINTMTVMIELTVEKSFQRNLMFSSDGKLFITHGERYRTQIWDLTTEREISPPDIKNAITVAFSDDGKFFALKHSDGLELWNVTLNGLEKHKEFTYFNTEGPDSKIIFSPDGKILLYINRAAWRNSIKLWDIDTGSDIGTLDGHALGIESLVFSHDGRILASGSRDGTILLWDWKEILGSLSEGDRGN